MTAINLLSQLKPGQFATINNISGGEAKSLRLLELGFTPGVKIKLLSKMPFKGSMAVQLRGSIVALRHIDAQCVEI